MRATEIHGLTDASVAHAPSFEHVADELLGQLGGAVLVGHNVTFDWRFLSGEYSRAGETLPEHDAICTLALARALELRAENLKLDTLAAYCHVPFLRAQFHDAREDVLATARVFAQLFPLALGKGINPLMHLEPELPPALHKTTKCAYVNPGRLPPGGPLIQGMHVAITGKTVTPREELYDRSLGAGLDVLNGVNSKTSLLVTNDLSTGTGKARAAIALRIPVVDEASYLSLIDSVAPGTAKEQLASAVRARKESRVRPAGKPIVASGPLAGRRVLLLGKIEDRAHLEELVTQSGGVVSHNVSKNISLVVLGVAYEAVRLEMAVGYGAEVLTPAELLARLHAGEDLRRDDPQEDRDVADESARVLDESPPEPLVSAAQPAVEVATAPAAPSLPPAAWYPDPSGRYQYRYWDGASWGPYVATNGQTYFDPIG